MTVHPSVGKVTIIQRVSFAHLPNLFCCEGRDLQTGELWYRGWSKESQEAADAEARRLAASDERNGRKALWIADGFMLEEGI